MKLLFQFIAFGICCAGYAQQIVVYPAPAGVELNGDFTVNVRQNGQAWKTLASYLVNVDEVRDVKHHVENASMSCFDFSGEVEVSVKYNRDDIQTARVRPLSCGIVPEVKGNTLTFRLNRPCNLSVEVNGDIFHNLHLFANPVETFVPDAKDPDVVYFGAGIHHPSAGNVFKIASGKTVYVSGGAVLTGQILIENVRDVKVLGRGIIDRSVKEGIRIANSRNIYVEGVTLTQIPTGGSDSVTIRNVKSISYYGWGDGMNVFASSNVLFDGVFCRNSDDCTTVYATRKGFTGSSRNITMQNSTLWADVAHPVFIGIHGNTLKPDTIEDLRYVNIDILDHKEKQIDYQGCLAINAGDNNLIRKVRFENIRIEDFRQGQLVNLRIFYNPKYCTAPGKGIEDVLFKDITYTGRNAELSLIAGYDAERKVKNIRFENLRINGKLISDDMPDKPAWYKTSDMARFYIGEHVENVSFRGKWEKDMSVYLLTYFKDDTPGLYFALSDDGYTFTDVNGGKPVIGGDTVAQQKGIRDPHITRGKDGAFYLAMTDLHIFGKEAGYRTTKWERDEKYGWGNNRGFVLMKSFDLIHWTRSNVIIEELFPGLDVGCAWAPQTIYDPEEDKMMIYFTMRIGGGKTKLYYAYTDNDFTKLITFPQSLFSHPDPNVQILDADITPLPDGSFVMMYVSQESPGGIKMARSKHINRGYRYDPRRIDFEPGSCEAPNVWKRIGENKWVLMYDIFSVNPHNFGFAETTDFETFTNLGHFDAGAMQRTNFSVQKHGAVIRLTKEEAGQLESYWKSVFN